MEVKLIIFYIYLCNRFAPRAYFASRIPYAIAGFFFSIRRRHTRFSRDWSSDVCSSDLPASATKAAVDEPGQLFGPLLVADAVVLVHQQGPAGCRVHHPVQGGGRHVGGEQRPAGAEQGLEHFEQSGLAAPLGRARHGEILRGVLGGECVYVW